MTIDQPINPTESINHWVRRHAWMMLAGTTLFAWSGKVWPVIALGMFSYLELILRNPDAFWIDQRWGTTRANWVTLFRHDGLAILLLFGYSWHPWILGSILTILALLDILDGYWARIDHKSSLLGGYLDKETDGLFMLYSGMLLVKTQLLPPWILAIGLLRYLYVLLALPWIQDRSKPERRDPVGRTIAVLLMIGMISPFFMAFSWYHWVMVGVVALAIFSFARSIFRSLA
ncbi:MAG TPA: CDP-alcohol phosphatidyltransferase family protein [Saprospiraceae bacterium]|nr:CDP-alcohol phosphatidyltransferase family protein [Saprospiraceae bacterium]HRV87060.1 CDP-alcohol phosphatidyltransferase family protein [Saprospiraceae bacterium]